MAMDDLAERIRASLKDPNIEPWFPELTDELTAGEWDRLHRDIGLTLDNYGTARILSRSISAPRDIITSLKICPSTGVAAAAISIEALTQECVAKYREKGVSFYSPDEILDTKILSCIEDALAIINQVPSLMRTVAALVRSLHVIKPEDADHDVSFSEPEVPFSIFVSVPQVRSANDALRVAEAIVHEAMHLQLTLIERHVGLVKGIAEKYFSPWRKELRTTIGMLHGLYVFCVVSEFLSEIQTLTLIHTQSIDHTMCRRIEIQNQIVKLQAFPASEDLTEIGADFSRRLIRQQANGWLQHPSKESPVNVG